MSLLLIPLALAADDSATAAAGFASLVLTWSIGAAAQGPALTAVGQLLAPSGSEAEALALPRAAGDGTFIVAPLLVGLVADSDVGQQLAGLECALAGGATLLGVLALAATAEEPAT